MVDNLGRLILRVAVGGLMLMHGINKMRFGIGPIEQTLVDHGLPTFIAYGVYVGEVLAPLLMIVGYYTRPAAAVVAFTMVAAVFLSHQRDIVSLNQGGGWGVELQALYFFGAVAVALLGAGAYSVSRGAGKWD